MAVDTKEIKYAFRVDKDLRAAFIKTAKGLDSDAAKELRKFMRQYVAKNGQKGLF